MSDAGIADRYQEHRSALRRRVCAVCLDAAEDGRCGLTGGEAACATIELLPPLVEAIRDVNARGDTAYTAAVETRVCGRCVHRAAVGRCRLRDEGRCGLSAYLPLIVKAVLEAEAGGDSAGT